MSDCIFCKIVSGEIPCYKIYEDEHFLVMLDRFPSSLGHTLIIPKKHFENIFNLENEFAERLFPLAKKITITLKESLGIEDFNILQNNGQISGQTVFHFHVHLIPRTKNDTVNVSWKSHDPKSEEFENMLDKIKSKL